MSRADRILIAAGGAALTLAVAAGWVLLAPGAGHGAAPSTETGVIVTTASPRASGSLPPASSEPATIVVDVEGAVVEPGIRELPAGARVADAIAAAGGYAVDADLEAASAAINLAERLSDGAQIVVPRIGSGAASGEGSAAGDAAADGAGAGDGGPVDLNSASEEELDALPGIGPVTVERIVEARRERPFESLQDAVDRGVLDRGQLEEIEGLATAG